MLRPAAKTTPERARVLLIIAFSMTGFVAFSWMARIPSVMDALSVNTPQFGAVLLVGSIGSVITVIAVAVVVVLAIVVLAFALA